jgi:VWFA-related protein
MKLSKLLACLAALAVVSGAQDRRSMCLFFDLSSRSAPEQVRARDYAIKFVEERTKADTVAIMARTTELRMVQDFTADHDALIAALRKIVPSIESAAPSRDADTRLRALQDAAAMLAPVAGKKSLVYFSTAMLRNGADPAQTKATVDAAVRANVALYPIDLRTP